MSQRHFTYHKSHIDWCWGETFAFRGERPATGHWVQGMAESDRYEGGTSLKISCA